MNKNTTAFLCKIPPKQNNKKSSQCTKKVFKKKFFCTKCTNFSKNHKKFQKSYCIFFNNRL